MAERGIMSIVDANLNSSFLTQLNFNISVQAPRFRANYLFEIGVSSKSQPKRGFVFYQSNGDAKQ